MVTSDWAHSTASTARWWFWVLDAMGQRTVWLQDIGQPSALELAYNAWVLITVEGIAESPTLPGALGVDPALVLDVVRGSGLDSRYLETKDPMTVDDELDQASFPLKAAAMDAGPFTDTARAAGRDAPKPKYANENAPQPPN